MNREMDLPAPRSDSYLKAAFMFAGGGIVTSLFSGSLYHLANDVSPGEVLAVGMVVPCFTWVVQLGTSAMLMNALRRNQYWADLGWICFWGSVALVPAGVLNFVLSDPPWWLSVFNVLASVALMAAMLFRRCRAQQIGLVWPVSWCATITFNMALFLWSSRNWW